MNPYLKSTRVVVGRNNEDSTPLWIFLLRVLPVQLVFSFLCYTFSCPFCLYIEYTAITRTMCRTLIPVQLIGSGSYPNIVAGAKFKNSIIQLINWSPWNSAMLLQLLMGVHLVSISTMESILHCSYLLLLWLILNMDSLFLSFILL